MKKQILIDLVKESQVIEIESDDKPFTHLLDGIDAKTEINDQQKEFNTYIASLSNKNKVEQPKFIKTSKTMINSPSKSLSNDKPRSLTKDTPKHDEENPESERKLKDIKVNIQTDDDVGEENMYEDLQN